MCVTVYGVSLSPWLFVLGCTAPGYNFHIGWCRKEILILGVTFWHLGFYNKRMKKGTFASLMLTRSLLSLTLSQGESWRAPSLRHLLLFLPHKLINLRLSEVHVQDREQCLHCVLQRPTTSYLEGGKRIKQTWLGVWSVVWKGYKCSITVLFDVTKGCFLELLTLAKNLQKNEANSIHLHVTFLWNFTCNKVAGLIPWTGTFLCACCPCVGSLWVSASSHSPEKCASG